MKNVILKQAMFSYNQNSEKAIKSWLFPKFSKQKKKNRKKKVQIQGKMLFSQ